MFGFGLMLLMTALSMDQTAKANQLQRRAADREKVIADMQNLAERRRAIATSRRVVAEQEAAAAATGTAKSSGAAGGMAAVQTGTAVNIGLQQTLTDLNKQRVSFLSSAQTHTMNATNYGHVANMAGQAGGYDQLASFFKG